MLYKDRVCVVALAEEGVLALEKSVCVGDGGLWVALTWKKTSHGRASAGRIFVRNRGVVVGTHLEEDI